MLNVSAVLDSATNLNNADPDSDKYRPDKFQSIFTWRPYSFSRSASALYSVVFKKRGTIMVVESYPDRDESSCL